MVPNCERYILIAKHFCRMRAQLYEWRPAESPQPGFEHIHVFEVDCMQWILTCFGSQACRSVLGFCMLHQHRHVFWYCCGTDIWVILLHVGAKCRKPLRFSRASNPGWSFPLWWVGGRKNKREKGPEVQFHEHQQKRKRRRRRRRRRRRKKEKERKKERRKKEKKKKERKKKEEEEERRKRKGRNGRKKKITGTSRKRKGEENKWQLKNNIEEEDEEQ